MPIAEVGDASSRDTANLRHLIIDGPYPASVSSILGVKVLLTEYAQSLKNARRKLQKSLSALIILENINASKRAVLLTWPEKLIIFLCDLGLFVKVN
jgi:hypothetical protein